MKIVLSLFIALFFIGCNDTFNLTKEMKEEKDISINNTLPSEIKSFNKDFITLKNGQYIDKNGLSKKTLEDGFVIIDEDLQKNVNILKVAETKIEFDSMIVTATKKDSLVAIIFADNHFELYDLNQKKSILKTKFDRIYAVSHSIAKPIFYNELLIVPTLNGKLAVYNIKQLKYVTEILVSNKEFFSNIIYFDIKDDYLIAASKDAIISRGTNFTDRYKINLKSVISDDKYLYLFTTGGKIIKMEFNLKIVKEKEFKFAHFISPYVYKNRILFGEDSVFSYIFNISKNLDDIKYSNVNITFDEDSQFLGDKFYYFNEYFDLKEIIE